jgi:Ca-activated chloride channel family protein
MELGSPWNLLMLAIVEVLAVGFVLLASWRRRAGARFAGERVSARASGAYWLRATLVVIAATLAVIAMARPQWGSKEFSREQEGVDVVIALDISQSMTATDVAPTRLDAAQTELGRLLGSLRGNRIGLVFFAGDAVLRSPLSTDVQALSQLIERAESEPSLARAGSNISAALDQALRILESSESPGKAVIVVSDGEDHTGGFATKARELTSKGVVVYSAGVGTSRGSTLIDPVRGQPQGRVKIDATGQPVITRLDETKLQDLAAAGGGRYVRIGAQSGNLTSLRDDLAQLTQTPLGEQTQRVPVERLQILVAAALIVLALAWFVPERLPAVRLARLANLRPRPGLAVLVVLLLLGGACSQDDPIRARNDAANKLYDEAQYEEALAAYQELLAERPDLPELAYNAGNSLNRLGRFDRAVQETARALPPATRELGARTYYALGNHHFALNQLPEAFEAYKASLLLDPTDADTKYNIELTLLLLNLQEVPPGAGEGAAQPGEEGEPGEESGMQPGEPGQEAPSGSPQQEGPATPNQEGQPSQAEIQRALQEALAGIDDEFTVEEANEILDLLQDLRQTRPGPGPAGGGPDY